LRYTPGGAFGSARYKLKGLEQNRAEYERLIEVFQAHDIGYFFYNGGGDSMDTAHKVSQLGRELGYPVVCIGVPKTVDNDLPVTDTCPGFGSVANTSPCRRARPRSTSRRWRAPRRACSSSGSWGGTRGGLRTRRGSPGGGKGVP